MRIYFCEYCGQKSCEVTVIDPMDRTFPSVCPFGGSCRWEPAYADDKKLAGVVE